MFVWGKEKTLEGTIDKFEWTQPHAFVWINVPDKNGKVQSWGFEGMSPSWLGRRGWNGKSLKAGEKVKLDYYPLKRRPQRWLLRAREAADGQHARSTAGRVRQVKPQKAAAASK